VTAMSSPDTPTTDRVDLAFGAAGSLLANMAYFLWRHGDQRMLLLLFATVVLGMGLLLTERRGALGMGILIGAALSIATALAVVAVDGSIVPGS
jgi:hypothetical protein